MLKVDSGQKFMRQPRNTSYFRGNVNIPLYYYALFGCAITFLASDRALSDFPWNAKFCKWVGQFIPTIQTLSQQSAFPEMCAFFFSVMFFMVPVVAVFCLYAQIISPLSQGISIVPKFISAQYLAASLLITPALPFILYLSINVNSLEPIQFGFLLGEPIIFPAIMLSNKLAFFIFANFFMVEMASIFYGIFSIPIRAGIHLYTNKM